MEIHVTNQALIFFSMVLCGCAGGAVFDLFRIGRKLFSPNAVVVFVTDLLFWLICSCTVFYASLLVNSGELRWYEFIGIGIGLILYFFMLSRLFTKLILAILRLFALFFRFLYRILAVPCRLLARPVRFAGRKTKGLFRRIGFFLSEKHKKWKRNLKMVKKFSRNAKK